MAIDYKSYDFQIYEYLIKLRQELRGEAYLPQIKKWQRYIDQERDRVKTRKFRVAVVGEFKRGKTSFINALLGREILPADASPTTATINRITYGSVPRASLHYKDGGVQEVEIGNLSSFVTKLTAESSEYAKRIEEAVVEYPSIFCQNYVDLIDTPGMNDDDAMNRVTVFQLQKIDLAIVAISAALPFSDTESSFMAQLVENPEIYQIVVVITYIDQIRKRDRERLISYLTQRIRDKVWEKLKERHEAGDEIFLKYQSIFSVLQIFAVSSLDALEAREFNDEERFEESGFRRLNQKLPQLILSTQNSSAIIKAMETVRRVAEEFRDAGPSLRDSLKAQIRYLENKKIEFAEVSYDMANTMMDGARVKMYGKINELCDLHEAVRKDFINRLSSIKDLNTYSLECALEQQLEATRSSVSRRIRKELNPWLEQCYEKETKNLLTEISEALRAILKPVETMFEEVTAMLKDLPNEKCLLRKDERADVFEWTESPLPPRNRLLECNIILRIEKSARQSLEDYCVKRKRRVAEQLDATCKKVGGRLEEVVVILYKKANGYIENMNALADDLEGKEAGERLFQIIKEIERLEKNFIEEMKDERRDTYGER